MDKEKLIEAHCHPTLVSVGAFLKENDYVVFDHSVDYLYDQQN